jgi:hypothetical protein
MWIAQFGRVTVEEADSVCNTAQSHQHSSIDMMGKACSAHRFVP